MFLLADVEAKIEGEQAGVDNRGTISNRDPGEGGERRKRRGREGTGGKEGSKGRKEFTNLSLSVNEEVYL